MMDNSWNFCPPPPVIADGRLSDFVGLHVCAWGGIESRGLARLRLVGVDSHIMGSNTAESPKYKLPRTLNPNSKP